MITRNKYGVLTNWTFKRGDTPADEIRDAILGIIATMGAGDADNIIAELNGDRWASKGIKRDGE